MTLQCIGKSRDSHGAVSQCGHTSDTPYDYRWPNIYLCQNCANAAPNRLSRPQYKVELADTDPPNYEFNEGDEENADGMLDSLEQAELDNLTELDLI